MPSPDLPVEAVTAFEVERPRLTGLAYRMLGTPDDADDVMQEAWLRYARTADIVETPAAWLTTVVTRLAIDRLRQVKQRRESYVGPWLAEPWFDLPTEDPGPDDSVLMAESVTLGFLTMMERLSPLERAVFLLHKVFSKPLDEVAEMIERSPAATRQLSKRANDHVAEARPRFDPDESEVEALAQQFMVAALTGDLDALQAQLAEDVFHLSDGGADRRAARRPILGPDRVAMLFAGLAKRATESHELHLTEANGQRALYWTDQGQPFMLFIGNWIDGQLAGSWAVVNPDKLKRFHRSWLAAQ